MFSYIRVFVLLLRQNPSSTGGHVNTYNAADGRDRHFLDALGSWPTWDWRGRLKIGAYTAELGKSHDRPGLEEVRVARKASCHRLTDVYLCGDSRPYVTMQTFSKNCYGVVSSIISLQC